MPRGQKIGSVSEKLLQSRVAASPRGPGQKVGVRVPLARADPSIVPLRNSVDLSGVERHSLDRDRVLPMRQVLSSKQDRGKK